jgi:hypothetical protein
MMELTVVVAARPLDAVAEMVNVPFVVYVLLTLAYTPPVSEKL